MRRPHPFLIVTGLVGLAANLLAIAAALRGHLLPRLGRPDPGLLAALAFVALGDVLALWSALVWRWARRQASPGRARAAALWLNALAALPLGTLWLYLLFSAALYADLPATHRWLLALLHGLLATPPLALGLVSVGEALGPLLGREEAEK